MPRLRHYDNLKTARFKLLTDSDVIIVFLQYLRLICDKYLIKILGYVIMPEHIHLVLHPPQSLRLGLIIGELKSQSASRIISENLLTLPEKCMINKDGKRRRVLWQPRCYDHNCRTSDAVIEKINYCHNNPVKKGLAQESGDWRWSSYNWFAGETDVALVMDSLESANSA